MKVTNYIVLIFFAVSLLTNCREKSLEVQIDSLPGKYCLNEGNNMDSLFLFGNSTYNHKFFLSENEIYESKGSWRFDSINYEISFYNFIFYNQMGPINQPGGVWYSKVYLTKEGEIQLIYSRENAIYYYKK